MPTLTIGNTLRSTARRLPNKTAFVFEDKRITYQQLQERANRLANGLLSKGCKPGDHVAILAFN